MKPSIQRFQIVSSLVGLSLFVTACQPNQNSLPNLPDHDDLPPTQADSATVARPLDESIARSEPQDNHGLSKATISKTTISNITSNDDIAKRLEISYARNAAYKKDECPKLVEFESIDQSVTREGEQLPSDYCEYFVFLNQGDVLDIHTSDTMHAKLISPVWFDFRNGSYAAPKFDKYTIRLSYDGIRYHPANFRYDVTLVKSGVKPS